MKLNNFKELLSKKAGENPNLQLLIKYMRDDYLIDHVVESLEKMAAIYSKKNPNHSVMHFGTHMDKDTEGDQIHDALSHHASHYKAALAAGNEKVADSHMKKIFEIKHMSEKMTRDGLNDHSGGKLNIEAVDPKPWERSGYANEKSPGKFSTDTKGWARHGSNYGWLRGAPHDSYTGETDVHGHKGAYPLEEMKVNGKHLHIEDIEHDGKHKDHSFDSHPIMSSYKGSPTSHTSEKHQEYLDAHDAYHDEGGPMDAYWDSIESRDPDEHAARGSKKADAIHAPLLGGDDAMARLAEITGGATPKQEAPAPKVSTKAAPAPAGNDGDAAMAKLKQIMGKDFKG